MRVTALDRIAREWLSSTEIDVGPAAYAVVVHVADVRAPVLVPAARGEGHLLLLLHWPLRPLQSVEFTVEGKYSSAGPRAQVYADLGEGGVDAELPEVRVLLEAADRLHGLQRHLPHSRWPAVRLVLETRRPFLGPPPEDPIDGGDADAQVAGDGLRAPAFGVQRHHGRTRVPALGYLVVGREAAHEPQGTGSCARTRLTVLRAGRRPKRT